MINTNVAAMATPMIAPVLRANALFCPETLGLSIPLDSAEVIVVPPSGRVVVPSFVV